MTKRDCPFLSSGRPATCPRGGFLLNVERSNALSDLRFIARSFGPYRRDVALAAVCIFIETCLELAIPLLMSSVIDDGVLARDVAVVWTRGAAMVGCAAVALVLGRGYARYSARAAMGLGANLRREEFSAVESYAFENLDRFETSSLVTRMTTDVTVIQNAIVTGFRPMMRGPIMLVMGLVLSCVMSARLAVVFFVVLPFLAVVLALIVRHVAPLYRVLQRTMDALNDELQQDLTAIRAIKAYVREDHVAGRFGEVNGELADTATRTFSGAVMNTPVFQLSMYVSATVLLWVGGNMILSGELQVGTLTGFMSYVLQIMNSLMMISNVFLLLARALTSIERVREVLDEEPAIESAPADVAVRVVADGSVEFSDVDFKYRADAKRCVLEDVNLRFEAGSTVGILGGTGSGKTSLVQLIARLYDATSGEVLVGGRDVRDYDLAALRDAVGVVLQKNVLFSGTVRDNLRWGDPGATDEELLAACRAACADEFLDRIGGLDGDLGQGGVNVSGGQKQRLCIARALLKRPRVLIFDDSTSAVDMATDARIRANLAALTGVTKVVIAQRVASVMDADQIVILDEGRVHAVGTHAGLLAAGDPIYTELCESQGVLDKAAGSVLPAATTEGGDR